MNPTSEYFAQNRPVAVDGLSVRITTQTRLPGKDTALYEPSTPSSAGEHCFRQAARGWTMDKKLCIASMAVGGVMLLVFLLDLIVGFPFGGSGPFVYIDIIGILCSAVVLYLGFHAWREVR